MARKNGKGRVHFAPPMRKIQKDSTVNLNAGQQEPATPAAGPNSGQGASEHQKNQTPLEQIAKQEMARKAGGKTASEAGKESVDALTEAARTSHSRTYGR